MIELQVEGHPDDPSRTAYGLYDAAAAVGYHRRAPRALARSPLFLAAYQTAIDAHIGIAGKSIWSLCPTIEEVREILAKQDAARHYRQHKAGYVEYLKPVAQS